MLDKGTDRHGSALIKEVKVSAGPHKTCPYGSGSVQVIALSVHRLPAAPAGPVLAEKGLPAVQVFPAGGRAVVLLEEIDLPADGPEAHGRIQAIVGQEAVELPFNGDKAADGLPACVKIIGFSAQGLPAGQGRSVAAEIISPLVDGLKAARKRGP